jgi:tetratricopeptide (TPR) repeat protein
MENRFLTETSAMRTLSFASPRGDHTFTIGVALVGFLAVAELFFGTYYFIGYRHSTRAVAAAPSVPQTTTLPEPAATAPAFALAPQASVIPAPTLAPKVAAAPAPAPAVTDQRLMNEGMAYESRGDTATALNRFQQAAELNPKNAQAYAEMAKIYESTSNLDRSNEMWRKVQELGPSSGAVYELADARLKRGVPSTPAPSTAQATPEQAATPPVTDGIPEGSTFGISEITATDTPDPDAETNLLLKVGVKKRANSVIDHTRVKIQVFFYDTVDDRDIALTDAEVSYEWLTPDHDWGGPKPEVLAVTYLRPKNKAISQDTALTEAAASMNPGKKGKAKPATPAPAESGRRKYLGYIVRIYYNDKLQAVRADPSKLLNIFPPPSTATPP